MLLLATEYDMLATAAERETAGPETGEDVVSDLPTDSIPDPKSA